MLAVTSWPGSLTHICWPADSQLTLEAVYSLLGMVSLCHASILDEPPVGTPQASPRIPWVFWLGAVQQVPALTANPRLLSPQSFRVWERLRSI